MKSKLINFKIRWNYTCSDWVLYWVSMGISLPSTYSTNLLVSGLEFCRKEKWYKILWLQDSFQWIYGWLRELFILNWQATECLEIFFFASSCKYLCKFKMVKNKLKRRIFLPYHKLYWIFHFIFFSFVYRKAEKSRKKSHPKLYLYLCICDLIDLNTENWWLNKCF